jgi:hypothetical protein
VRSAIVVTLVCLVLLEVSLRIVLGGAEQGRIFQFHTPDGRCVSLKPGAHTAFTGFVKRLPKTDLDVNALGYRGSERQRERTGRFRVAIVGDSYPYGFSVRMHESIPAYIEQQLGPGIEVLNFGLPGASLEDLVPQAQFALQWQPDLMVLFVFWNDLFPSLCSWSAGPLSALSRVARFVYVARLPVIVLTVAGTGGEYAERADRFREYLTKLASMSRVGHTRFAVVVLGDPIRPPEGETIPAQPTPALQETLDSLQVPWLDARTWRSADSAQHPLPTIPWDGHFTAEGNEIAAARVGEWLTVRGLLRKPRVTG